MFVQEGVRAFGGYAQCADHDGPGAVVPGEVAVLDRDQHADAGADVSLSAQGFQATSGGPVERGQNMFAGSGDVVCRAGFGRADPFRISVGPGEDLDVAAMAIMLYRIPQVVPGLGPSRRAFRPGTRIPSRRARRVTARRQAPVRARR